MRPLLMMLLALASTDAFAQAQIRISDVDLFYKVYDAAGGAPTAQALQKDYIEAGSDGVRQFIPHRILSSEALAATILQHRAVYEGARKCLAVLPDVKTRLSAALQKLAQLYPDAAFPPVTVLIGRDNSAGTTGKSGVLVGLEVACRADWLQTDLTERLLHLIAHEYGHVQQREEEDGQGPLLTQALLEGGAELVAELISGQVSNVHLQQWTRGHERSIEERFLADADGADFKAWLYNGPGTPDQPGDLGYWVGYRIAKAFYARASDKRAALKTLLELRDPKAVLALSGWKPGQSN